MMALFIDELQMDGMSVDVDGIDEKRDFHVKEYRVKRWKGRWKMDGRQTETLMCHLIPTLRDTRVGGLRSQS